jgi:hypothetical protein
MESGITITMSTPSSALHRRSGLLGSRSQTLDDGVVSVDVGKVFFERDVGGGIQLRNLLVLGGLRGRVVF